ncbi:pantothenate kinase 1 isoform X1 [Cucurbita maxima]|uniref:pantothenate kinase n=1 Tax=Cucurbita maxima TaxID=3661 RepID=A0A6J1HTJ9_CUCMA|nr:pantothenate kinase 1 isoform X1 [Cucurbita maxima]
MDLEVTPAGANSDTRSDARISHLALDIGGTLAKLVYFSGNKKLLNDDRVQSSAEVGGRSSSVLHGRLHFAKFETRKIDECIAFIHSKELGSQHPKELGNGKIVKATGGGAFKFADLFKEKLDVCLDKEDEMDCLVAGANFLLKAVHQEAFTYIGGQKEFVQINQDDLYPFLLVNIGSGVSMIKVDGNGKFERVSGTSLGGGTFWGLGKLLTKCNSFDELLELSQQGNNRVVDMLVGDIYGGGDYNKIGLSSTAIASSFGKTVSANKVLENYRTEDLARSLLRMISNNIGQLAYLTALRFGLRRIFFGGFFIRGQCYTMDTISVAVHYWSKGDAQAMFMRHEGFLGALGAFMSYNKQGPDNFIHLMKQDPKHEPEFDGTAPEEEDSEYASIDCFLDLA